MLKVMLVFWYCILFTKLQMISLTELIQANFIPVVLRVVTVIANQVFSLLKYIKAQLTLTNSVLKASII